MLQKTQRLVMVSALAAALMACGDDDGRGGPPGSSSDAGPDAAPGPDGSDVVPGADAAMNSEGPTITVLTPSAPAAGDLSSDEIVTSEVISARCRATANTTTGDAVDATSVQISAISGTETFEAAAVPTSVPDEYTADLVVSDYANGPLTIRCSASDLSTEARQNSAEIGTFLDLGPLVQILSPIEGTSFANQTNVVFTVTAAPVAMNDTGAAPDVGNVELRISGTPIANVTEDNGTYTAQIVFDDAIFNPELDGLQTLAVRAPNTRTTTATIREATTTFTVDADGPTIAVTTPTPGELVGGIIEISANVTDPAGIMPQSVTATMGGTIQTSLNQVSGSVYTGSLDTRGLGPLIFPNVIVRARDTTGNQSSVGFIVSLDNASPILSLDSPALRESKDVEGVLVCSQQFDPLGDDAVSDGQSVPQLFEVRARLEDLSNAGTLADDNTIITPIAHVDPSSVQLFFLDDSSNALVVDTDGDGFCDDINPLLVPKSVPTASGEVAVFDMAEVASTGASSFVGPTGPFDLSQESEEVDCTDGTETDAPPALCVSTPLTRVISTQVGAINVIYGVPPLSDLSCLGNGIDALASNVSDGWACMAVRGSDNLGNTSVSLPLRLCVDSDQSGDDGCPPMDTPQTVGLDNCTGTYDSATDTVDTTTPCTLADEFPENSVRRIDL